MKQRIFPMLVRALFPAAFVILLTIGLASAQEGSTGSGTFSHVWPAASLPLNAPVDCSAMIPPVVGYEISRGQDPNDAAGLLGDLAAGGFSVGTVNIGAGPIPACVDVLIVAGLAHNLALTSAYTAAEGAALKSWTAGGHGLMLLSDWGFFKDNTQALFQAYGYTLQGGSSSVVSDPTDFDPAGPANSWVIYQTDNFASHPALRGVAVVELIRSAWLAPSLNALVTTDADASPPGAPVMAAFLDGPGCALLAADSNWIMQYDSAYLKQDNARAARQMIGWLDGCGALALTKAATPGTIPPGQLITYTLTAASYYTYTLTSVSISDTVPAGTTFVSASAPHTGPDLNGVVQWPIGTLGAGDTAAATLVVQSSAGLADGALITNTAQVASAEGLTDTAVAVVRVSLAPTPTPTSSATPTRTPTRTRTPTATPMTTISPSPTATATPQIPVTGLRRIHLPLILQNACAAPGTYRNDFENTVGPEWSSSTADTTPSGRRFLGQFGNETVSLTLACLPAHTTARVSFDLLLIRSWDGNIAFNPSEDRVVGPDVWDLSVAGGPPLLHTTFSNWNWSYYRQAYPGAYPGGDNAPRTGAAENDTLGYRMADTPLDAVYHLTMTFPHTASSLRLDFSASGLQILSDESWGLDNVEVSATP